MENTSVGGIPFFSWITRKCLPHNKRRRVQVYTKPMIILTYVTYSLMNMSRKPIAIVKTEILQECQGNENNTDGKVGPAWCHETLFTNKTEEFLGFLDAIFILAYGLCLYVSGAVADCYNPRFYLTAGCLLSGFFCALLGLMEYWEIRNFKFMGTMLVLFAASQSTGWPVVLSCVTHWHSGGKMRGTFFGFWNTHNYTGSVLGIVLAGIWVEWHWRWSFFVPGFILAFMGIVVYLTLLADPRDLDELDFQMKKMSSLSRRLSSLQMPTWLSATRSITMYDAWTLPGVMEFSSCMFFNRMVGYFFLYQMPVLISRRGTSHLTPQQAANYAMVYVAGGSIGGVLAGLLVDILRRSALVCAIFSAMTIPALLLGELSELGKRPGIDFPIFLVLGIFVEAPYIVITTSVSADLATNKLIKRNHRALSTVGGIIEGTGAVGAAVATFIITVFLGAAEWEQILYLMMALQFIATLCVSRQAYTDLTKKQSSRKLLDNFKVPSL